MKKKTSMAFLALVLSAMATRASIPNDTIRAIAPLFDPVVIQDNAPDSRNEPHTSPIFLEEEALEDSVDLRGINTSYKIGTPRTRGNVSSLGAATWSLTFDVPPGVGGLTPEVGVSYNSHASNSNVGWGISITGISVITRGMKSVFYDGTYGGVTYGGTDALYLDGRRLRLVSGSPGTVGAVYSPDGDPYTTVTVTQSSGSGPLSFETLTPDGRIYKYGQTSNSRMQFTGSSGGTKIASWYVSYMEDSHGNYMEYTYTQDNMVVYPERISYGKNRLTGTGADNSVRFTYTGVYSGTLRRFYLNGVQGGVYKCLKRVDTMTGESVYRQYVFGYNPSQDASKISFERLETVTVKNSAGDEMNPVTLTWTPLSNYARSVTSRPYSMTPAHTGATIRDSLFAAADMDGDGLADLIRISTERRNGNDTAYAHIHRSVRSADGSISYDNPLKYRVGADYRRDDVSLTRASQTIADIDGDGLSDMIVPLYFTNGNIRGITFRLLLGKDVRASDEGAFHAKYVRMKAKSAMPGILTMDLDGNGREDILFVERKAYNGSYYANYLFSEADTLRHYQSPLSLPGEPLSTFLGDYNGDGLADLIVFHQSGYKIFYHTGYSSPYTSSSSYSSSSITQKWRMEQGDFNGDGLPDFVYVGENSPDYYFALNKGDGTFETRLAITYTLQDQNNDLDDDMFHLAPLDIDHDGFTDLVVCKGVTIYHEYPLGIGGHTSFDHTGVGWLLSDGVTLTEARQVRTGNYRDSKWHNYMVADFDGDGYAELMNYGHDLYTNVQALDDGFYLRHYASTGNGMSSGRLVKVTDALGSETSFEYSSSCDTLACTQEYGDAYPLVNIHAPMPLVSGMTTDNGLSGTHTMSYRYKGLKAHALGKGVLGFMDVAGRDLQTGVTRQDGVRSWNGLYYTPSVTYTVETMGFDNDSTITTMSVSDAPGSNYTSFPAHTRNVDMDGNETTTTRSYSLTHGYLTQERVEYGGPSMYKSCDYQDYVFRGNRWLPQRIVKTEKHFQATSARSATTQISYDAVGNMLSTVTNATTSTPYTESRTYDTYGNVLSVSKSGQGVHVPADLTEYDSTGRFAVRESQSVDSEVRLHTYDTWGNLLTDQDATNPQNILVTSYQRDGWGDCTCITDPTGQCETITRGWGASLLSRYYVQRAKPGQAPVKTWYDIKGQTHQTESKGPLNTGTVETFTYNAWGKTSQITRRSATRIATVTNYYDYRGRMTYSSETGKGYTTFNHGNRSVSIYHGGGTTTKTYDAWGGLLTSVDPLCSVTYSYLGDGLPSAVVTDDSVTVTMEYDAAGRRISMTDPDAGTSSYVYAADGRLLRQTDGRGIQTVISYDSLGRVSGSVCDTLVTTYTYGTSGNSKMRLTCQETNGMKEEYTYDAYGRVTFEKRTFDDGEMTGQSFFYNDYGQVSRRVFPSSVEVTYTYDANGYRDGIYYDNVLVWRPQSYDGSTLVHGFGNTTVTTRLSQAGQLTERYAQKNGQTAKLYQMSFAWDGTTGNLSSCTGVNGAGVTEVFSYDVLDRLTAVRRWGVLRGSFTYANNGNILSKTGMGEYGYLSARPHAVTSVENEDYLIQSAAQTVDYNPFGKAARIEEGTNRQTLRYGPDMQRWVTRDYVGGQLALTSYYHGDFEKRTGGGQNRKYHFLGENVLAVLSNDGIVRFYYMLEDNVGSVVHIMNGEGTSVFDASYDAWGAQTVSANTIAFHRGYGGHEMLPQYRLVNMNGRLYDSALGRFLSPDNYVQVPESSQGFNRYSYCLNNPLKYTDPSGEFFFGTIINFVKDFVVNTFGKSWTQGINAWTNSDNWHSTVMSFKIETGFFRGSLWQVISRFTWEAQQTVWGHVLANIQNTFYGVKNVTYYGGATAVETYIEDWGGFTLGNYIMGQRGLHADPDNTLFQHEYGHYLQSQSFGLFYIQRFALPSLIDCCRSKESKRNHPHNNHPVEQDANIRAYKYFKKHIKGYGIKIDPHNPNDKGWNMEKNGILGYDSSLPYSDPNNQAALGNTLNLGWADYVFGFSLYTPSIINIISLRQ